MIPSGGAPPPPGGGDSGGGGGEGRRRRRRRGRGGGGGPRPEGAAPREGQPGQQQRPPQQQGQRQPQQQRPQQQRPPRDQRPQREQRPQQERQQQRPQQQRPQQQRPQQQRPQQQRPEPHEPEVAARPAAEIDAGWGLPDEPEAPAQVAEPEIQRTPTPPLPPDPLDPDGDDLFVDLSADEPAPKGTLVNVAGVKFREAGNIYEYDAGDASYRRGERVIVESDRGPTVATVAIATRRRPTLDPLRRIVRPATQADEKAREKNVSREREAYLFCKQRIRERNMPMKLTRVETPLGGGKILFYFASEECIDFRELVRDLAQKLHARIEMRQIGARDEAKMVGGIGACGRELCCSTWLPAFVPISIKMAKDQGLPLNPSKVSGQCGRLKCCLVYEQDTYKELRRGLPKVGKRVKTPAGEGKVVELDVLRRRVRVWFEEGGYETFPGEQIELLVPPQQQGRPPAPEPEDSDETEAE